MITILLHHSTSSHDWVRIVNKDKKKKKKKKVKKLNTVSQEGYFASG